jgi:membrane-associated phospholipid phosphatase
MRMSAITRLTVGLLICGVAVTVSYLWIDRPVSYFAYDELRAYRTIFDLAARLPKVIGPLVIACTLILGVRAMMKRPFTETQITVVLSAVSLALSNILENWLKFAFGRTWPETWMQNNPSLIRDGVYNFNPFRGGPGFAAFPSGHMVAICAIMSVFWLLHPRFRLIYAICIATVFVGELGANYHFVSDLIAGGFLGFSTGWIIIALRNEGIRQIKAVSTVPPRREQER